MDLLNIENMGKVVREFVKSPTFSYVSVYNALTKNYNPSGETFDDFGEYMPKWKAHPEIFQREFEPYSPSEFNPGFYHVKHAMYNDMQQRKHRIYINPPVQNRAQFIHILMKECINEGIDFYFKYARSDSRADNLLIYASDEQLEQYANVLKRIEVQYPDLVNSCSERPLSATSVSWYSYGPEDKSSEKGSLSQRVAKIVRKNISKMFVENRHLYNIGQVDEESIGKLYKACISRHASEISGGEKDVFAQLRHDSLEKLFRDNAYNIARFILNANITQEDIENDISILKLCADDGKSIDITPSAISTMLAGLKPNFSSYEERDRLYQTLLNDCTLDIENQNLNQSVPRVLQDSARDMGL